jgi:hypothetical protein
MKGGNHVEVPGQMSGKIVANIDTGEFSADYPASHWAYLKTGLLVETHEAGLIHLPKSDLATPINSK